MATNYIIVEHQTAEIAVLASSSTTKIKNNSISFDSLSDRVASLTIKLSKRYTRQIIQVYAPTSSYSDQEVEDFYELVTQ